MNLHKDLNLWRKALQTFNKKVLFAAAEILFLANFFSMAQNSSEKYSSNDIFSSLTSESVLSPSMPNISFPTIDESFYNPGNSSQSKSSQNTLSSSQTQTSAKSTDTQNLKSTSSILKSNSLSAADLFTLDSAGLLTSSSLENLFNENSSQTQATTVLQKILDELETLKTDLNKISQSQNQNLIAKNEDSLQKNENSAAEKVQKTDISDSANSNSAKILRFRVNSYDILKTCKKIYISKVQDDGTFLVTGDRRYLSDGKFFTETFHILFKVSQEKDGISNYSAAVLVMQDSPNQYSFLYQLSQRKNLTASRVGNLLSMKISDPNWQLDFLIDLD